MRGTVRGPRLIHRAALLPGPRRAGHVRTGAVQALRRLQQRVRAAGLTPATAHSLRTDVVAQARVSQRLGQRALRLERAAQRRDAVRLEALVPGDHEQRARRGQTQRLRGAQHARHEVPSEAREVLGLVRQRFGVRQKKQERVRHQRIAPVQGRARRGASSTPRARPPAASSARTARRASRPGRRGGTRRTRRRRRLRQTRGQTGEGESPSTGTPR